MASLKRLRTYKHKTHKPQTRSEKAFDDLMAKNLSKRLELSSDQTAETTFDRLLQTEDYNKVVLKTFPENCILSSNLNSSSSFSYKNTSNLLINSKKREDNASGKLVDSSALDLSSRVVLNEALKKNTNSTDSNQLQDTGITRFHILMKNDPVTKLDALQLNRSPIVTRSKAINRRKSQNLRKWEQGIHLKDGDLKKQCFMNSLQLSELSNQQENDSVMDNEFEENNKNLPKDFTNYSGFRNLTIMGSTPLNKLVGKNRRKSKFPIATQLDATDVRCISHDNEISECEVIENTPSQLKDCGENSNSCIKLIEENSIIEPPNGKLENISKDWKVLNKLTDQTFSTSITTEEVGDINIISSTPLPKQGLKKSIHLLINPSKSFSLHTQNNNNPVDKSYEIIERWNHRSPSLGSFNIIKPKINNKFNDSKLRKKAVVILEKILDKNDLNEVKNRSPLKLKWTNTNVSSKQKKSLCRLSTKYAKSKLKKRRESSNSRISFKRKLIVCLTPLKKTQMVKYNSSLSKRSDSLMINNVHKCSEECNCFRKKPFVLLTKLDKLLDIEMTPNDNLVNAATSPVIDLTESTDSEASISIIGVSIEKSPSKPHGIEDCFVSLEQLNSEKMKMCDNLENLNISKKHVESQNIHKQNKRNSINTKIFNNSNENVEKIVLKESCVRLTKIDEKLKTDHLAANEMNGSYDHKNDELSNVIESSILCDMDEKYLVKPGKKFRRSMCIYRKMNSINIAEKVRKSDRSTNMIFRRSSIRVVALNTSLRKDNSDLAMYARSDVSYVSGRQNQSHLESFHGKLPILIDSFEDIRETAKLNEKSSIHCTAKDIVLRRCGQTEPLNFSQCYPESILQHCQKIGEGVYGEVFMFRDKDGSTTVMKVIPIEGDQIVNQEKQKTFEEIISEIVISMELNGLRYKKNNNTTAFCELKNVRCVQGCYPERLLDLWALYDENKVSENDSPEIFLEDQLYIVLELGNAGCDLEAFQFKNAEQSVSVFKQVACALAAAENEHRFEHRDLHWGNVLIKYTKRRKSLFIVDGNEISIPTMEVEATIIDFTLSRIENDGLVIYNDLAMDVDLFSAKGDYQFEIYRLMQKNNGNEWQTFQPYSNILWLHYLLDKAITGFRYKTANTKVHKRCLAELVSYKNEILEYKSTNDFVLENFC